MLITSKKSKKSLLLAGAAACIVAGWGAAANAAGTQVSRYRVRGNFAYGNAGGGNDCSNVWVDFGAHDNVQSSDPGQPTHESGAWVGFGSYDWCTGRNIYGSAFVPGVVLGRRGADVTIDLKFEAYEQEWVCEDTEPVPPDGDSGPAPQPVREPVVAPDGEPVLEPTPKPPPQYCYPVILETHTVHVAATLTPTGPAFRGNGTYHWRSPDSAYHSRYVGITQHADLAAEVQLDGVPVDLYGSWGEIGSTNEGQVMIGRW